MQKIKLLINGLNKPTRRLLGGAVLVAAFLMLIVVWHGGSSDKNNKTMPKTDPSSKAIITPEKVNPNDPKIVIVKQHTYHKPVKLQYVEKIGGLQYGLYIEAVVQNVGDLDVKDVVVGAECDNRAEILPEINLRVGMPPGTWYCMTGMLGGLWDTPQSRINYLAKGNKETCTVLAAIAPFLGGDAFLDAELKMLREKGPPPSVTAKILKYKLVK